MHAGLRQRAALALLAALVAQPFASPLTAHAQQSRPRRAGARPTPVPVIPAGSRTLPAGMTVLLRLESRLDSSAARASDRFTARVAGPVKDSAGNVVLPAESEVVGHVAAVKPAERGRRSGIIEIAFDRLRTAGREYQLSGELTSAEEDEREQLDADGNLTGEKSGRRSVAFIGGGAGVGAALGVIAGSALVGAGVGAAVGATAVLLAKGKEAVVEPGTLVGMRLTAPLDLNQPMAATPTNGGAVGSGDQPPAQQPAPPAEPQPAPAPPEWQPVNVSFAQAERTPANEVLALVTVQTRGLGWLVKAEHQITDDKLEVWVKGMPPAGRVSQAVAHPTLTLTVPDKARAIRRVVIHGANGDRWLTPRPSSASAAQPGR